MACRSSMPAALAVLLGSVAVAHAQFGGFGNGNNGDNPFDNGDGFGDGGDDYNSIERRRAAHGVLGALAMVILFPTGSIMMRLLPGRVALWAHAVAQCITLLVYIGAVGMGIRLVRQMQVPGTDNFFFTDSSVNYHPIIGLVVLAALLFQPVLGIVHHKRFKRIQRRQVWSYLHLYTGRIFITLGIINGGLGLKIAGASDGLKIAYGVIAAIMWLLWMMTAVFGELRVWRAKRAARNSPPGYSEVAPGPGQNHYAKPVAPPQYE